MKPLTDPELKLIQSAQPTHGHLSRTGSFSRPVFPSRPRPSVPKAPEGQHNRAWGVSPSQTLGLTPQALLDFVGNQVFRDCSIDTGIFVGRPEGAATNQPRATPWDRVGCRDLSPERAKHRWPRVAPFQGLRSVRRLGPRALPWADLFGPFGAESPYPVSLL